MGMMDIFNIICGVCSVAGLLISVFTASKVVKISKSFSCDNQDDHSRVTNKNSKSTFRGSYVGRDNVNGTGNSKQE
ncbi:hypothetical protein C805_02377 [Eubacterium sp. 14-2]|nr:hypothetical protein C805_02377 [Eubacterium sp. 14-2]